MTDPGFEARRILERVGSMLERVGDLQAHLRQTRATAESVDGRVSVTVGPSGALLDLRIDPRAMRMGSEQLTEQILAAAREATAQVSEEISRTVGEVTGENASAFGAAATGKLDLFGGRAVDVRLPDTGDANRDAQEVLNRTLRNLRS